MYVVIAEERLVKLMPTKSLLCMASTCYSWRENGVTTLATLKVRKSLSKPSRKVPIPTRRR